MKKPKYLLIKKNKEQLAEFDFSKINGLIIKPKNKINYDGVLVNKLILINNKFIEMVLKKKIKNKLNTYLGYIIEFIDNDPDGDNARMALSDIERYKGIIINRYAQYLDEKYISLLLKKIDLIEKELVKKYKISLKRKEMLKKMEIEPEQKIGKSR